MSLTTAQRRQQILSRIYEKGQVSVKDLAAQIEVSEATVRRDLRSLADSAQLDLVYGGATLPSNSDFSFRSKAMRNVEGKRLIGRLAAELVADDDILFLDSGTTSFEMCPHLKRKRGLSVIVNSARLAVELSSTPDINVIMVGGQYRADRMDTIGPLAIETLEQLRGYVAFIGADGLSLEFGVTASDIDSAHLHRLAVRNARETILIADHFKLLTPSLFKIADVEEISRFVTDQRPPDPWLEFLNAKGIELICPDEQTTGGDGPQQSE